MSGDLDSGNRSKWHPCHTWTLNSSTIYDLRCPVITHDYILWVARMGILGMSQTRGTLKDVVSFLDFLLTKKGILTKDTLVFPGWLTQANLTSSASGRLSGLGPFNLIQPAKLSRRASHLSRLREYGKRRARLPSIANDLVGHIVIPSPVWQTRHKPGMCSCKSKCNFRWT